MGQGAAASTIAMDLIARNLSVTMGGKPVLDDVSVTMRPGRVTAILGPNGSGKSILLRCLAGLAEIDGGQVKLGNRIIARVSARDRAKLIGHLPQETVAPGKRIVRELVALGRRPHRARFAGPTQEDQAEISAAMAATGTMKLADRRVSELSGGEQRRAQLARVLAGAPQWLLADEPFAALDDIQQLALRDQLRGLAAAGMGIAVALHDLTQAARIADDMVMLRQGGVVLSGERREVLTPGGIHMAFRLNVAMVDLDSETCAPVTISRALTLEDVADLSAG
ncbi:ABC transporter ATP-binding protein [Sphingomonas sp. AOB5]|uniref:ABC transporter ATP-binding protein n=1 Tax=Sphingomonas sp. AOB5 TaxID=3034017 RepID=UPI0023F673C4|nr:ABC transporter ATP-binding protein [Sphingomonas sp. AOB5]MDF7777290.1 ABC transporter ATP-binding protein [Sphingomonas sp. AOB5]